MQRIRTYTATRDVEIRFYVVPLGPIHARHGATYGRELRCLEIDHSSIRLNVPGSVDGNTETQDHLKRSHLDKFRLEVNGVSL